MSGEVFDPNADLVTLNVEPDLLKGAWVTSHAGLLQIIGTVQDDFAPPQTAGYDVTYANNIPTSFTQREGYFHTAAVTFYVFDGGGGLTGYMEHVRGGHKQHQKVKFFGTYEVFKSEPVIGHFLYWGRIFVEFPLPVGNWNYYFVMKNLYEAEWVWTPPPLDPPPATKNDQPRPLIARGTLTKVRYGGWLRRAIQRLILG
jgi:hypothetical protein